jgi:hypothetical protein
MARRRLTPTIQAPGQISGQISGETPRPGASADPAAPGRDVPRAEHPDPDRPRPPLGAAALGTAAPSGTPGRPPAGAAPIARVAAEAAGQAALDEVVENLRRAQAEGRMVLSIPLDDIAADHIARDRRAAGEALALVDEDMIALRESLRAHGQRMPIEVTPLRGPASDEGADGGFNRGLLPYGLISGWRRLSALRALHAETGEERFATARALIRRPDSAGEAYVAMVEENEIRAGLSQYERARIAAIAAERGIFPSEKAALLALFAGASRAKRSRIRAFVEIYHALDAALRFPTHLPERLGLRLVECLRAGRGEAIVRALAEAAPETPEAELEALEAVAKGLEAGGGAAGPGPGPRGRGAPEPGHGWSWERIGPELELGIRDGAVPELRLRGRGVSPELRARIRAAVLGGGAG